MLKVINATWPAPTNVTAFTTTRSGGVSNAPYQSLNLATHVGDQLAAVLRNRALVTDYFKFSTEPVWLEQVHGIQVVPAQDYPTPPIADASYTTHTGIVCAILTADCLPVLICDRAGTQIAAIHAGWRGLVAGIIEQTLLHFVQARDDLLVWLGPAIGPKAFEVGAEVREQFLAVDPAAIEAFRPNRPGHWLADLYLLAKLRLAKQGINQVYGGEHCTYQEADHFYSYRRDGKQSGRMASFIWMK